jgi:hypothetical protein
VEQQKHAGYKVFACVRIPKTEVEIACYSNFIKPEKFVQVKNMSETTAYLGSMTRNPDYCSYTMRRVLVPSKAAIHDNYSTTIGIPDGINRQQIFEQLVWLYIAFCSVTFCVDETLRF